MRNKEAETAKMPLHPRTVKQICSDFFNTDIINYNSLSLVKYDERNTGRNIISVPCMVFSKLLVMLTVLAFVIWAFMVTGT